MGTFASGGGLDRPWGMAFGPDGNLYVSSVGTDSVLRYRGTTGEFIDVFATGGGLNSPKGLAFGRDGNLYVTSYETDNVLRYDGETGAFMDVFASGGGLDGPTFLTFSPIPTPSSLVALVGMGAMGSLIAVRHRLKTRRS
jgi:DNA-binding beta-propeller fold protein YncE